MQELGQQLKEYRLKKGISLEDISEFTRIRVHHLESLEAGNMQNLPAEVYAIGFLRSYLKYLGVPTSEQDEIVSAYKQYYQSQKTVDALAEEELIKSLNVVTVNKNHPEKAEKAHTNRRIKTRENTFGRRYTWLVLGIIIIVACGALYFIGKGNATKPQVPITDNPPNIEEPTGEYPDNQPVPPVVPGEIPPAEPPADSQTTGLKVVVTATTGSCWLGVTADGVYSEQTLKNGDSREFMAEEKISIRFGNAGAVKVDYNGTVTDPLGVKGEVKTVDYVKE